MTTPTFAIQMLYPVDGDSAIAEILYQDDVVADLTLAGIDLRATGEDRVKAASVQIRVYSPLEFDVDRLLAILQAARARLLENEQGRLPDAGGAG